MYMYSTDLVFGSRVSDKVIDRNVNVFAFLQLVQGVHKEAKIKRIWSGEKDTQMIIVHCISFEAIFR